MGMFSRHGPSPLFEYACARPGVIRYFLERTWGSKNIDETYYHAIAEALKGLHRFSPKVQYLGSYPRADKEKSVHEGNNSDVQFGDAEAWFKALNK